VDLLATKPKLKRWNDANKKFLVPKKGLEPPHPCGYMDLNHARLPIPPLRQVDYIARPPGGLPVRKNNSLFYRRFHPCQTGLITTER
jgi:hypothetical protein